MRFQKNIGLKYPRVSRKPLFSRPFTLYPQGKTKAQGQGRIDKAGDRCELLSINPEHMNPKSCETAAFRALVDRKGGLGVCPCREQPPAPRAFTREHALVCKNCQSGEGADRSSPTVP